MQKKIKSALISVFYKNELDPILQQLQKLNIKIYSTGGTKSFIDALNISCTAVEDITGYPSILDGRVKTLHPAIFGGLLARRSDETHCKEMKEFHIPEIDLVIVDLYPFAETVAQTNDEKQIIEKIDIGGPSMIRAAAKNFDDVVVVASKNHYSDLLKILSEQSGTSTLDQRKWFAAKAFEVVKYYDIAISDYFNPPKHTILRYGENAHQSALFKGNLNEIFSQLNGKELSYNNLTDVDAAIELMNEFSNNNEAAFAIIKHTNVCGMALASTIDEAWQKALAGDPQSAFGGVLITNKTVNASTAGAINEIFFEVLIAPDFEEEALMVLKSKKNRILLKQLAKPQGVTQFKSLLNGVIEQDKDSGNFSSWNVRGNTEISEPVKNDLIFANRVCKHLKSNAIALVKNNQLIGKGCGQTSRIDAVKQAIEKAKQFAFDLSGAVMASDAFFPFDDCVKLAHENGIKAFIQPGGSVRDQDSINYCLENNLAMVMTGMRHFKH